MYSVCGLSCAPDNKIIFHKSFKCINILLHLDSWVKSSRLSFLPLAAFTVLWHLIVIYSCFQWILFTSSLSISRWWLSAPAGWHGFSFVSPCFRLWFYTLLKTNCFMTWETGVRFYFWGKVGFTFEERMEGGATLWLTWKEFIRN